MAWWCCVAGAIVGCQPPSPRTAVEYEQDAAHRRSRRDFDEMVVRNRDITRPQPSSSELDNDPTNPIASERFGMRGWGAGDDERQRRAIRRDEENARRIREVAAEDCARVPTGEVPACPLPAGAPAEIIERGVRIRVAGAEVDALSSVVRCARDRVQVAPPAGAGQCPLFAPGADVRVLPSSGGAVVEIVGHDRLQTDEIRRRAQAPLP